MNHFKYSLKEPALSLIINGTKKIEGRLCKNTFKNINSGDIITFYNKDSKVDVIVTKVAKFNIGTELRMVACKSLRKSYNNNIKNFDKISIMKPSIKELKKETLKVIKNIGPTK